MNKLLQQYRELAENMKKRILKAFFGVLIVFTIGSLAIGVKGAAICLLTYAILIFGVKLIITALEGK